MDKRQVLDTAIAAVCGERPASYGPPKRNFDRIAALWNDYIDRKDNCYGLTGGDVAVMMILVKVARLMETPDHADSWVDIAGYAACGGEVSADGQTEPWRMTEDEVKAKLKRRLALRRQMAEEPNPCWKNASKGEIEAEIERLHRWQFGFPGMATADDLDAYKFCLNESLKKRDFGDGDVVPPDVYAEAEKEAMGTYLYAKRISRGFQDAKAARAHADAHMRTPEQEMKAAQDAVNETMARRWAEAHGTSQSPPETCACFVPLRQPGELACRRCGRVVNVIRDAERKRREAPDLGCCCEVSLPQPGNENKCACGRRIDPLAA